MTHDNHLRLSDPVDASPHGISTVLDATFVSVAAVVGIFAATMLATLVAPLGAGVAFAALFVGWPLGFAGATGALRVGSDAVARTGLPALTRDVVRQHRTPTRMATDGGRPEELSND
jgi:hypothetical protein